MDPATPKMRYFAERLISCETAVMESCPSPTFAAASVIGKLRPQLATLMGTTGFRALLCRALVLAAADAAGLYRVTVAADGTLVGMDDFAAGADEETAGGSVALIARLLGLLVAFIGEILTLRLVRDVWPDLVLNEYFIQGDDKHEETN